MTGKKFLGDCFSKIQKPKENISPYSFHGQLLDFSHMCLPCVLSRWVSPCVLCPLWDSGGSVVSFEHGEYGFSSMGSWCYCGEWVWNSTTKLCCLALGEWNASIVSLQEFDIRYMF